MIHRRFRVKMSVEIDAVTCPGVWLCPNGRVELTFRTLGYHFKTNGVEPRFPLLFHEKFHLEGYYRDNVRSLASLEVHLAAERVDFSLYQRGTRLAFFTGQLGTLLRCNANTSLPEIHSQILMRPTQSFPGIISPKISLVTKVQVHEDTPGFPPKIYYLVFGSDVQRIERQCSKSPKDELGQCQGCIRRRQRPVCHVRQSHVPGYCSNYPHRFMPIRHQAKKCHSTDDRSQSPSTDDEDSSYAQ